MSRVMTWKAVLIVAVVGLAAWSAYPPGETVNLGLDLKGGMHMVLQVTVEDAFRAETEQDMSLVRRQALEEGVSTIAVRRTGDTTFEATGVPPAKDDVVEQIRDDYFSRGFGAQPRWLMRRSGERLIFDMSEPSRAEVKKQAVDQAVQTIRNRVDAFGVTEPVIAVQGASSDRIVVQLPGVDDPERVRRLIKNTAFLEFRLVDERSSGQAFPTRDAVAAAYGGTLPQDVEVFPQPIVNEAGETVGENYYALEANRVITGRDLRMSRPTTDRTGGPAVGFDLSPEGARQFGEVTGQNIGRLLSIVLDGKIQSVATIQSRITDSGIISGRYTQQEVQDLVTVLRSGALPAGLEYLEKRTVGPSLGQDSIEKGLRAGLLGALLVVVAMLIVYKLTGINAVLALTLNIVLVFGALAYFGATLTLPGIAGIILTIGMAVDANVLVFERIREELRAGRTVRSAIDAGFSKALSSILDANLTTLIAAVFLFQFGTGPIRGFAVTLSVGILASVFTAVFVSRFLFDLILSRQARVEKLSI